MNFSNRNFLYLLGLLLLLWQPNNSKAQTSYSYGSSATETFRAGAFNPTDNSFLLGGLEDTSIDPALLVNVSDAGIMNWAKKYAYTQSMDLRDIHMKDDGHAVVLFYTLNTSANRRDALLMEVDGAGSIVWAKTYVNTSYEVRFRHITALSSGEYILTGNASVNNATSFNNFYLLMMKIDAAGNMVWVRRDQANNSTSNMSINEASELSDGNLLVAGHMWHSINNNGNYHNGYVAKIDITDGTTIWNREYPSSSEINFYQSHELANGDIVIAARLSNSNTSSFTTSRQLFVKINSTGVVQTAKEYDFPGGNTSFSFKMDDATGNLFFVGYEAATTSTADRDNYWVELTDDGDFVNGYRFSLSDFEGVPMIEVNDVSINVMTTTKSFPADPTASANNDFAMFLIDRSSPLMDCNISQFEAAPTTFTFSALEAVTLSLDEEFSVTEGEPEITEEEAPFQQRDICEDATPALSVTGVATDGDCDPQGSIDITVTGGEAPYTYAWSNGTVTEDQTALSTGTYDVTVTDNKGDTATATFTVTSDDTTPPVALCQQSFVYLDPVTGTATVDPFMVDAGSSDNCGEVTFAVEPNMFSCADIGDQTVFLYVTDLAGNTDVCQTIVTVVDNTPPVAMCKDVTLTLDADGMATVDFSMIDDGSSDACGISQVDVVPNTFDCSNIGTNTVTVFVADPSGNTSICTSTVTILAGNNDLSVDATVTNIPCDGSGGIIDITVTGGIPGYTFQWSNGSEDEDLTGITDPGTYVVIITDACGNQIEQAFDIMEEQGCCNIVGSVFQEGCDNMGTCDPSDDVLYIYVDATNTNPGASGMFNAIDANTSTLLGTFPYGGGGLITLPYNPSMSFISIVFQDVDNPECISEGDASIELLPCPPGEPSLSCPDDINMVLDGTGCEIVVDYVVDADPCEGYTLTQTAGLPSGSAFPLGTTVVTYELSNGTTTITCSFNVNVSNVAPTPADYILSGNAAVIEGEGECYQLTTTTPTYQSGSIYYQSRLNLDYDFQLDFEVNLGSNDGGADGMMFILQPISSSLGGNGGNLGFSGIGPSVGIEFDTWRNNWAGDPFNDHISFQRNGNLRHTAAGYLDASVTLETIPNIEVGAYRPVTITWNAATKELTYIYNNRPARTVTQDITNTIFGGNPNVFWGWSAGTGSAVNNQSVCITGVSFVEGLTVDANIIDVPCDGLGMIDLTVSGGIPDYTFQWSDGSTDEDLAPITQAGDYTVIITDACGHTVEQTYTVGAEECPCIITSGTLFQEGCDNMGTCDPSDDIVYLYLDVTAQNPGPSGMFNAFNGTTLLGTFPYGNAIITIPYTPSISVTFVDVDDPTCTFDAAIDLQPCDGGEPSIVCPDDINVGLGDGCETIVDYVIDFDDCGGTYTLTQTAGLPSGSAFPLGTTVVTYELSNGTTTVTCSFNVNVSAGMTLYGLIGDDLVTYDTNTGAATQVATLSTNYNRIAGLTYHSGIGELLAVADAATQPKLISIDRVTGAVTVIGDIDQQSPSFLDLRLIEAMQYNPDNGLLYIAGHENNPANGGWYRSTKIMTVDPATGDATLINAVSGTCQDESDGFAFGSGVQYTMDGCNGGGSTGNFFYTIDLSTGTASLIGSNPFGSFGHLAVEPGTGTVYCLDATNREFMTISTTDATLTTIGATHTASDFGGELSRTLAFAPIVIAPMVATGVVTDIPCDGTGMIDLTVTGGIAPYTYQWSDGSANEDLTGITTAGSYWVIITDACGNQIEQSFDVGEECCPSIVCPDDINATLTDGCEAIVDYVIEVEDCDGTATVTLVSGLPSGSSFPLGTTTVTYQISNGTTSIECSFNVNVSAGMSLYGLIGDALVTYDTNTGVATQVATLSMNYNRIAGLTYHPGIGELLAVADAATQPKLISIDRVTGAVTVIGNIDQQSPSFLDIRLMESMEYNPNDGLLYGVGYEQNPGTANWYRSVRTMTIDPATGDGTFVANISGTCQDDADMLGFGTGVTYVADGCPPNPNELYTFDVATATATYIGSAPTGSFSSLAVEPTTGVVYSLGRNDRELLTISTTDATLTTVGTTHTASDFGGELSRLLTFAPSVIAPMVATGVVTDIPCDGTGAIDLTVTGGVPGYTFQWSDGSTNEDLTGITDAGSYWVIITDACGNQIEQSFDVAAEQPCDCTITPVLVQEGCDNMGTSDTSDDIITLYVDATAINGGTSFNVVDASTFATLGTFQYGVGGLITIPYSPSISLIYEDATNPECNESIAIDLVPCEYCTDLNITITVDNYPKETSWELTDANGNVIQDSNGHLGQNPNGTVFSYDFCLPDGCYEFTIYDSYGDGICCDPFYGNGSYTVTDVTSGTVLGQGGQFGFSETTSFCFGNVQPPVSCTYEHVKNNGFEGGWGIWNDGGDDCARVLSSGIGTVGNWSIRLRDNTASSVMTSNSVDLTDYVEATVIFDYKTISMDNPNEDFFLEISLDGGATFTVLEEWNQGDEFQNNINYTDSVVIPGPFTANTQFRFRCDASGDGDYVYIDRVQITGCKEDPMSAPSASTPMSRTTTSNIQKPSLAIGNLYPNPATDYVNIDMKSRIEGTLTVNIYTTTGQLVYSVEEYAYEGENQFTVNLDRLNNGTYMVEINDGKKTDIQRLVIMK